MYLAYEESLKHLSLFLSKIEQKPDSWRLISIEFQNNDILHSTLFENLCAKSLKTSFEETECRIFWVKPEFILIFFQGRALPIEKCVEEFFKATEFKGFGRFFDILDLSVHWEHLKEIVDRITKTKQNVHHDTHRLAPSEAASQIPGFKIDLSAERIAHMEQMRAARARKLVLLVEDDPFTQQLVKLAIKDQFDVISAETARQALAYYQRHLPDMVFLDIQLPDGNGLDLLSQITKADKRAHIVMLSSHTQREKIMEAQSFGAKGFIGKPFTRQRLVEATAKFLTGKSVMMSSGAV